MRYLLDTHILLWGISYPERLPSRVRELVDAPGGHAVASVAAIWEIAIKYARNRGRSDDMPINGQQALRMIEAAQILVLDIHGDHAAEIDSLPLLHSDPFDRLMVAQARFEDMTLITRDKALAAYGDFVLVV